MSEDATDQSNCSSDGESVESNVDDDVSTHVNVSVPCPSDCACMCKAGQGVITLIEPVEPFATRIKMKSRDQHIILY